MKIVGLITEYNPFHNGHAYHIAKAKELTGADSALVVMSGNYVQRGTPAILPKHLRARMALENGADVVLELPLCYATGSAEYFAMGAVRLLDSLGCVDALCFGSECADIHLLSDIARIIADEPEEYRILLQNELRTGSSYPLARQKALKLYLQDRFPDHTHDSVLEHPNNILGIEYLKALYRLNSHIQPFTIKRMESDYHDSELKETYSSASAIRKVLTSSQNIDFTEHLTDKKTLSELADQVPETCFDILKKTYGTRYPILANDFSLLLKYRLLTETSESLLTYLDMTEDLANRIVNLRNDYVEFEQFCELLKTRNMTYSRISRCLLHILLDIRADAVTEFSQNSKNLYAHILGFRKEKTSILSLLNQTSQIPLISKLTQTDSLNDAALKMLKQDIFASDLYESIITDKFKTPFINEYRQQVVRV